MESNQRNFSRAEKIIFFLYENGKGEKVRMRYEDIVSGLFKKYPQDFQMKGYPEFPDSGDLIHKPLYDFKKKGLLTASNKIFCLTDRGVEFAKQLSGGENLVSNSQGRLSRSVETEISRIKGLEGFLLFIEDKKDKLSDNDFYTYLGVTVRTQKNAFIGRLETIKAVAKELHDHNNSGLYSKIIDYHEFLLNKNKEIIDFFIKN